MACLETRLRQHTPMKAHAVTTIDQAATDKQLVPPTKEAAHQFGEEAATNVSASAQGTADEINNKVTSNAFLTNHLQQFQQK